jgi:hypothetical protein
MHEYVVVSVLLVFSADIWSALASSALKESNRWLQHLESCDGIGVANRIVLVVWRTLVSASTAVYGRRSSYHKRVRRLLLLLVFEQSIVVYLQAIALWFTKSPSHSLTMSSLVAMVNLYV